MMEWRDRHQTSKSIGPYPFSCWWQLLSFHDDFGLKICNDVHMPFPWETAGWRHMAVCDSKVNFTQERYIGKLYWSDHRIPHHFQLPRIKCIPWKKGDQRPTATLYFTQYWQALIWTESLTVNKCAKPMCGSFVASIITIMKINLSSLPPSPCSSPSLHLPVSLSISLIKHVHIICFHD